MLFKSFLAMFAPTLRPVAYRTACAPESLRGRTPDGAEGIWKTGTPDGVRPPAPSRLLSGGWMFRCGRDMGYTYI